MSENIETHACDCGFTWQHGKSGSHACEPYYRKTISNLRADLAATQEELGEWRFTNKVDELQRRLDAALAATAPTAGSSLFDRKLADLVARGHEVIGSILHKDGQYALFDSSCRWLTKPQYQRLMHEQDGSLFATAPTVAVDDREAFEAWALAARVAYRDEQYGLCWYNGEAKSHQWIGWQARAKLSAGVGQNTAELTTESSVSPLGKGDCAGPLFAGVAIPEGWALVPVEPTNAMLGEAFKVDDKAYAEGSQHGASIEECWIAMLAAAPSPAKQEG